jgi:hypothetical protein
MANVGEEQEMFPRWFVVGDSVCADTCFVCAREKAGRDYERGTFGTVMLQPGSAEKIISKKTVGVACSSALREMTAFSLLGTSCHETVHCLGPPQVSDNGSVSFPLERAEVSLVNFAKCARARTRVPGYENMSVHFVLWSLLKAVTYLNRCQLMHRDLKPGNVLVFPGPRVALCDFGAVRFTSAQLSELDVTMSDVVCTKFYAPPEEPTGKHNLLFDSYSIAATVVHYAMSTAPMFHPMTKTSRRTFIKLCKPYLRLLTIVRMLVRTDPAQRYSAAEALQVFEDFFPSMVARFKSYNVSCLRQEGSVLPLLITAGLTSGGLTTVGLTSGGLPCRGIKAHDQECKWDRFHDFKDKVWPTLVKCIQVCQVSEEKKAFEKSGCLATAFYVLNMLQNVSQEPEPPCYLGKCYIMLLPTLVRVASVLTGSADDTEDYLGICHGMLQPHRCVHYHNVLTEAVQSTRALTAVGPNWIYPAHLHTLEDLQTELQL